MKMILIVLLSFGISACVFRAMPKCELPPEGALESCSAPLSLQEKHTYAEALEAHGVDKKSLSDCKIKHEAVVKALDSCNSRIDKYNDAKGKLDAQQ